MSSHPSRFVIRQVPVWILLFLGSACCALGQSKSIEGTYRNPAEGFSIRIPAGLNGVIGEESGPQRGVRIPLPSGGQIYVYGEPNSFEWKTAEEGVRAELEHHACGSGRHDVAAAVVGKLRGAKGLTICGDRVVEFVLAFRPHGDPIYWLRLETAQSSKSKDDEILQSLAASFKLIRWK